MLDVFLANLLQDSAGFGGAKMIRRVIGLAHVVDLESIGDHKDRATAERAVLHAGRDWVLRRHEFRSVDDLLVSMKKAVKSP
ncbi:MAG: S-methyl-5-thioribose kinase, partial [Bacilli bacterium]